ncbi:hypothetical protein [Cytobacillus sp. IB215665]|uniref:hypothetical protein n=1 Tax=Cytobacillus sp. IB215665 TaxID=3097357 RepID=UPI002A0DE9C3|nr:hypothetical protein [Cytobacillus sp. IB215665]MDX8363847.1 hypothetical protein [Cytobacillus sp. IB215665]
MSIDYFIVQMSTVTIQLLAFTVRITAFTVEILPFTVRIAAFTVGKSPFTVRITVFIVQQLSHNKNRLLFAKQKRSRYISPIQVNVTVCSSPSKIVTSVVSPIAFHPGLP